MIDGQPKPERVEFYEYPFRLDSKLKGFKINDDLYIKKMDAKSRKRLFGISHVSFKNGLLSEYRGRRPSYGEDGVMFMNKHHLKSSNYILVTSESNEAEVFNLALKLLGLSSTSLYIGYGNPIPSRRFIKNSFYELNLPPITIKQEHINVLSNLVEQININSTNKKFNLLSDIYIHAMSDKIRLESRYLELSTILESLILPIHKNELTYRFKLRLAKFINKHYAFPLAKVYEDGKKIYETRSQIVHSGSTKNDIKSMTKLAHEYVHKLLWKYLENETLFTEEYLVMLCLE